MCAPEGKEMYKAVVYYGSKQEADNVITKLNDEKLAGKHIHIRPLNETTIPLVDIPAGTMETHGVYVSEIPKALCESKLQPLFAKYGNIAGMFLEPDKKSAYISYYKLADAQAALNLNNQEVHGCKLKVSVESMPTTLLSSIPLLSNEPTETASFTVQIKHLGSVTTTESLYKIVKVFGAIVNPLQVINGNPRYAFVSFATLEAANAAVSHLHNQPLDGTQVKVKLKSTSFPPLNTKLSASNLRYVSVYIYLTFLACVVCVL